MANIKNFSDTENGAIELTYATSMPNAEFRAKFPGVKGIRYDGYTMWVGRNSTGADYLPVTRKIEYKSFPSKHVCNSKCLNGKHNGTCECQCGGKNHGAGMFTSILEAA
jgi:hypothetical protein